MTEALILEPGNSQQGKYEEEKGFSSEGGAVYIGFEELGPLGTDHKERGLGGGLCSGVRVLDMTRGQRLTGFLNPEV